MWNELAMSLQSGNVYILTMLVLGFLGMVILFERFIMLQFVYNIDFPKFLSNLKKMVRAEDMDRAINLCKQASHTSLAKISLRALEAAETDPTTVRGTIEEETIDFLPKVERRLASLPAISTLVFLVGILGTIDGLWGAFHSIDVLDTAQKQASAAQGITGSLNATTLGILMCMIFLTGHQLLKGVALRLIERVHHGVAVLHNLLVPQDVAAFVPVTEGVAPTQQIGDDQAQTTGEAAPQTAQEDSNENFDDASVEDIKDEEEII